MPCTSFSPKAAEAAFERKDPRVNSGKPGKTDMVTRRPCHSALPRESEGEKRSETRRFHFWDGRRECSAVSVAPGASVTLVPSASASAWSTLPLPHGEMKPEV